MIWVLACGLRATEPEPAAAAPSVTVEARAKRPPKPEKPAGITLSAAPLPPPPFESPFALGINEALAIPGRLQRGMTLDDQATELASDATYTAALGTRWVRAHTGNYPDMSAYSLGRNPQATAQADLWLKTAQTAGFDVVMMVSPWPGNDTGRVTQRYLPDDMAGYRRYVQSTVERYDGDGVDDMPGLVRGVRYWEVDNEPDLKNSVVAKGAETAYEAKLFCTPAEYGEVLIASSEAIRAAMPDARILIGGFYRPHAKGTTDYLSALFALPTVLESFDVLSAHTYHDDLDGERLAIAIRNMRTLAPQKPLWVTETSMGPNDRITEDEQARMVATLIVRSAMEGADKVFWHTLADPPETPQTRQFPSFGKSLYRTAEGGERTPKPAAEVFRHLAAVLREHDLNGAVADGEGAARLSDGSILLYDGERTVISTGVNLRDGTALAAGSTANAPAWLGR